MGTQNQKNIFIYGFLLLATVLITIVIAFVLVPETGQNQKFWLSLSALIAAEAITFIFPLAIMLRGSSTNPILPFHLGTETIIAFYDLGVLALCFAALLPIAFSFLFAAHLIWFLFFLILIGSAIVGGMYVGSQETSDSECRIAFTDMQDRLAVLNSRLAMIPIEELIQVKREFVYLCEEAKYLSRDSLVGSESVETEIDKCLETIGKNIFLIESVKTKCDNDPMTVSIDSNKPVQSIFNEIKFLRQLFIKRDDQLKNLRQLKR